MTPRNPYLQPSAQTVCSWPGYLYFVHERESIRLKREDELPEPWTKDPVLQKYRFTNIRRRDDRMTRWFIKHLIKPYVNNPDLWFTLLIGRLINWPPTLQALIDNRVLPCSPSSFNKARFVTVIESLPGKRYGSAYMVYPTMRDPGGVKSKSIAEHIIGNVIEHSADVNRALWGAYQEPSIERFVTALSRCFGISTFIAGQVAADLTYDLGHLGNAVDLYTWAPLGPGSQRGLNFLHAKSVAHSWTQNEFNTALCEAGTLVVEELGIGDLTLHDVQNSACEFSKYVKAVQGLGKPKSIYKPETEY